MQQEKRKISVDTGSMLIDIDDKGETIGTFRFNPSDLDIAKRYEKVAEKFTSMSVPEDPSEDELFAVSDEIKDQLDYLLNYKVSSEIFCKCNPLTPTANGDFFFENVLEAIAGLIEEITDERIKQKKVKIQKAVSKYHK